MGDDEVPVLLHQIILVARHQLNRELLELDEEPRAHDVLVVLYLRCPISWCGCLDEE